MNKEFDIDVTKRESLIIDYSEEKIEEFYPCENDLWVVFEDEKEEKTFWYAEKIIGYVKVLDFLFPMKEMVGSKGRSSHKRKITFKLAYIDSWTYRIKDVNIEDDSTFLGFWRGKPNEENVKFLRFLRDKNYDFMNPMRVTSYYNEEWFKKEYAEWEKSQMKGGKK